MVNRAELIKYVKLLVFSKVVIHFHAMQEDYYYKSVYKIQNAA